MKQFLVLGVFSTLVDYLIYSILIYFGISYIFAIILGYGCGFLFNFYYARKFVFKNGSKLDRFSKEFLFTFIIAIMGILINIFVVFILSEELFQMSLLLSRVIAIVVAFFWNYYARKIFIYH